MAHFKFISVQLLLLSSLNALAMNLNNQTAQNAVASGQTTTQTQNGIQVGHGLGAVLAPSIPSGSTSQQQPVPLLIANQQSLAEQMALLLVDHGLYTFHDAHNRLLTLDEPVAAATLNGLKDFCSAQTAIQINMGPGITVPAMGTYNTLCRQIGEWSPALTCQAKKNDILQKIKTLQATRSNLITGLGILEQNSVDSLIDLSLRIKLVKSQLSQFIRLLQAFTISPQKIEELQRSCEEMRALCSDTLWKILINVHHDPELKLIFVNLMNRIDVYGAGSFTELLCALGMCNRPIVNMKRAEACKDCVEQTQMVSCALHNGFDIICSYIDATFNNGTRNIQQNNLAANNKVLLVKSDHPLLQPELQMYRQAIAQLSGREEFTEGLFEQERTTEASNESRDEIRPAIAHQPIEETRNDTRVQQTTCTTTSQQTGQPANQATESTAAQQNVCSLAPYNLESMSIEFMNLILSVQGEQVNDLVQQDIPAQERIKVLFNGTPGVGKTTVALALAKKIQQIDISHHENPRPVYLINIATCQNSYVRSLETYLANNNFAALVNQKKVVIFDELDALSSDLNREAENSAKAIGDCIDSHRNTSFIAIANRSELIPYIARSRLANQVEINKPDTDARYRVLRYILSLNMQKINRACLSAGFLDELSRKTRGFSIRDIENLMVLAKKQKFDRTHSATALIWPEDIEKAVVLVQPGLTLAEMGRRARQVLETLDHATRNPLVAQGCLSAAMLL